MPGLAPEVSGSSVPRFFVERAGITREPVPARIDFTHRTFEEFLAAKAASDKLDIGLLIEKAHNDQWREVIILASGLASEQMREELIKGLLDRGDKEAQYRHRLHLLAVSCLETSVQLGQEVQAAVEQRLSKLVPPKNMTDAKALAAAGESVVKYLSRKYLKKKYPATVTAACIRTLGLIGGEAALDVLEEYVDDGRLKVEDEFLRAWDYYDREIYVKRIWIPILRTKSGILTYELKDRLPYLDGFQFFTSLTSLNLSFCSQISDLSPLAGLTQLTSLDLSDCLQITDLSLLIGLPNLKELTLYGLYGKLKIPAALKMRVKLNDGNIHL